MVRTTTHGKNKTRSEMIDNDRRMIIDKPTSSDVLFGRGNAISNSPGMVQYRTIIGQYRERYLNCSRSDKTRIAKDVIAHLESLGARFVDCLTDKDNKNTIWEVIEGSSSRVVEKVCQCLREKKYKDPSQDENLFCPQSGATKPRRKYNKRKKAVASKARSSIAKTTKMKHSVNQVRAVTRKKISQMNIISNNAVPRELFLSPKDNNDKKAQQSKQTKAAMTIQSIPRSSAVLSRGKPSNMAWLSQLQTGHGDAGNDTHEWNADEKKQLPRSTSRSSRKNSIVCSSSIPATNTRRIQKPPISELRITLQRAKRNCHQDVEPISEFYATEGSSFNGDQTRPIDGRYTPLPAYGEEPYIQDLWATVGDFPWDNMDATITQPQANDMKTLKTQEVTRPMLLDQNAFSMDDAEVAQIAEFSVQMNPMAAWNASPSSVSTKKKNLDPVTLQQCMFTNEDDDEFTVSTKDAELPDIEGMVDVDPPDLTAVLSDIFSHKTESCSDSCSAFPEQSCCYQPRFERDAVETMGMTRVVTRIVAAPPDPPTDQIPESPTTIISPMFAGPVRPRTLKFPSFSTINREKENMMMMDVEQLSSFNAFEIWKELATPVSDAESSLIDD